MVSRKAVQKRGQLGRTGFVALSEKGVERRRCFAKARMGVRFRMRPSMESRPQAARWKSAADNLAFSSTYRVVGVDDVIVESLVVELGMAGELLCTARRSMEHETA